MNLSKSLGWAIRERRKECDLSQLQLALDCGLSLNTINEIERGIRKAKLETLCIICKALDIPPSVLLDGINL